ncbi:MAG: hypothetical protein AAF798_11770 [Bacteroidota bacterium]
MRSIITLILMLFSICLFAQRTPVKVDTWEGKSYYTSDYQLENRNGIISILVEGDRLTLQNIKRYQKDTLVYRFENPGQRYKIYQRKEDNPKYDIYSTNDMVPFALYSKKLVKKTSDRYEAGENGRLKRFNAKNLRLDLASDPQSIKLLNEAKRLRLWERLSYTIPIAAILFAGSTLPQQFENSDRFNFDGALLTVFSVGTFAIPLSFNRRKREKYREAVQIYDGQ